MRHFPPPLLLLVLLVVLVMSGCGPETGSVSVMSLTDPASRPPPSPPPFCTHSLGTVDCWSNPAALNGPPARGVADGPQTLTPDQEANRKAWWLHL